eukprot:787321-Pyramimonas_sp.AAC.1
MNKPRAYVCTAPDTPRHGGQEGLQLQDVDARVSLLEAQASAPEPAVCINASPWPTRRLPKAS